jgi:hypothetical protein
VHRDDRAAPGRLQPLPTWALGAVFLVSLVVGALAAAPLLQRVAAGGSSAPVRLAAISVQGNQRLSAGEVASATGLARGQTLESIEAGAVVTTLEAHPWIRCAEAVDLPTGDLIVRIEERQPRAALSDGSTSGWRWVDDEGVPFAATEAVEIAAMPKLYSDREFETGAPSALLAEAVSLALEVPRRGLPSPANLEVPNASTSTDLAAQTAAPEGWVLHTGLGGHSLEVVLGWGEALGARLDRLAFLLTSDLQATRTASRVDLRFEGQAVLQPLETVSASMGGG